MQRLYPTPAELPDASSLETDYLPPAAQHVRANFAVSIDGMVSVGGRSAALGGSADRVAFMAMRAVADVILVGAGTVRAENYGPVQLEDAVRQRRLARHQTPLPALAIVSNRAALAPTARVFTGPQKPLLLTSATAAATRADLAGVAEIVVCGDDDVDLTRGMAALRERALGRVLCEGGPTLLGSLIGAELLDEFCCTTAPALVGAGQRSLAGDRVWPQPIRLRLTAALEGDGMIFARYASGGQP
jgi:riboflavin biosynthesis pyrimidine reductase